MMIVWRFSFDRAHPKVTKLLLRKLHGLVTFPVNVPGAALATGTPD